MLAATSACEASTRPSAVESVSASPSPTPKREYSKMSQDYINAIKSKDESILEKAGDAPEDLPKEIDRVFDEFDEDSRELAVEVVTRQDSKYSGVFLLRRMNDPNPDVAMSAIESMEKIIHKPGVDEVISAIPRVKDPFVRGKLYLDIGMRREEDLLGKLRHVVEQEEDEEAALRGLAALVRLGGKSELQDFTGRISKTEPDDALEIQDLMLYTGKQGLAAGLVSWLDRTDEVMRLGGDRQDLMARMNDVGIWTAHMLKVGFPFETSHLRIFTDEEVEQARTVLKRLGN